MNATENLDSRTLGVKRKETFATKYRTIVTALLYNAMPHIVQVVVDVVLSQSTVHHKVSSKSIQPSKLYSLAAHKFVLWKFLKKSRDIFRRRFHLVAVVLSRTKNI